MAQHRMVSNRIINSAKFIQMPIEAQLLYFHLIIRADDDGVVECYPVMKLLGTTPDNFKVLLAKGFIRQLNEDQVIVIEDWLEHNTIRADRKVDSIYKNLLVEKCPDLQLIEPKPRSDVKDNSKRLGSGLSTVSVSKVKLSQVKLSKDKLIDICPRKEAEEFFNNEDKRNIIIDKIVERYGSNRDTIKREVDKFTSYWTEKNKSGTKHKWELQETFEVRRRLVTWLNKDYGNNFDKSNKSKITSI